ADCYGRSLRAAWSLHDTFAVTWSLRGVATIAAACDPLAATRLFARADVLARQNDWSLPPFDREQLAATLEGLRARLGAGVYEAIWRAGEAAELEPLVAEA